MVQHKCDIFYEEYGCEQLKEKKMVYDPKNGCVRGDKKPFNDLWRTNTHSNPKPIGECPMSSSGAGINDKEPMPQKTNGQPIWEMVIEDMKERDLVGENRYGMRLQKFNGRNSPKDAYQEILDFTVYARQWVEERKEMIEVFKEVINSNAPMEMSDELYWKIESLLKRLGEL